MMACDAANISESHAFLSVRNVFWICALLEVLQLLDLPCILNVQRETQAETLLLMFLLYSRQHTLKLAGHEWMRLSEHLDDVPARIL